MDGQNLFGTFDLSADLIEATPKIKTTVKQFFKKSKMIVEASHKTSQQFKNSTYKTALRQKQVKKKKHLGFFLKNGTL